MLVLLFSKACGARNYGCGHLPSSHFTHKHELFVIIKFLKRFTIKLKCFSFCPPAYSLYRTTLIFFKLFLFIYKGILYFMPCLKNDFLSQLP